MSLRKLALWHHVRMQSEIFHLVKAPRAFAQERDWEQFHTPKNLACALSVEASELL